MDTYIHIGAVATEEEVPTWYRSWSESALNFSAWERGSAPRGTDGKRCAVMNVNNGLWAAQDCGADTAFVCEKLTEEKF